MTITTVLFDLNGTLIDDWPAIYAGVQAIYAHYRKPCPSLLEYIAFASTSSDYLVFYQQHGLPDVSRDELYRLFLPAYHTHGGDIHTTPHVHEVLRGLARAGYAIHIVTAAQRDFAEPLIDACALTQYCDAYHYDAHNKDVQIRAIIASANVRPHECMMIGDLPSDVIHAKRADIHGIGYITTHVPRMLFAQLTDMNLALTDLRGLLAYVEAW